MLKVSWCWHALQHVPCNTDSNTSPEMNFRDACLRHQGGAHAPKFISSSRAHRYFSLDASLGVCTLLVVKKNRLKCRPRGYVIWRVVRYTTDATAVETFLGSLKGKQGRKQGATFASATRSDPGCKDRACARTAAKGILRYMRSILISVLMDSLLPVSRLLRCQAWVPTRDQSFRAFHFKS